MIKQFEQFINESRETKYEELLNHLRGLFKTNIIDDIQDILKTITPTFGKVNAELDKAGYWPCVEGKPKATYGWTYSRKDGRYLYEIAKDDHPVFFCTIGVVDYGAYQEICVYEDKGARRIYGSFKLHPSDAPDPE